METARITFSFDDAREDSYNAIKIAQNYGISCTLNVTAGYVDGSYPTVAFPPHMKTMTKEQVVDLYNSGVEIACHGDDHNNDKSNLIKGRDKLANWLSIEVPANLGIASPHSKYKINSDNIEFVNQNFAYMRIGGFVNGLSFKDRLIQKMARICGSRNLFLAVYKKTVDETEKDYPIIRSVPVLRDNTCGQIEKLIRFCQKKNRWCVLCFHSIVEKDSLYASDNFSWSMDKFVSLCGFIKNHGIVTVTTKDGINSFK